MRYEFNFSKLAAALLCSGVLMMSAACREHSATPAAAPKAETAAKQQPTPNLVAGAPVYDFLGELPFVKKERISNLRRIWRGVPKHGNYSVVKEANAPEAPGIYDYGEIAGAHGLALMVVDKTKTEDNRFGLVVFIERPADAYTIHWIYRDTDLRRFQMSRSSGDIFVRESLSDGSTKTCEIQWTKRIGQWNCEPLSQ